MQAPPLPSHEEERLDTLEYYNILDTPPEEAFDDLTELASYICGTPIALVSLVDANRQWFKSKIGIEVSETPREISFCAHAIVNPQETLIVPNATQDDRFADNPLVKNNPNIRFYAGTPLVAPNGYPIGTLCVIDQTPRNLTPQQLKALNLLGRQVIAHMELRINLSRLERQLKHNEQVEAKLRVSDRQVVELLESMTDAFIGLNHQWCITYVNQEAARLLNQQSEQLLGQEISQFFPEFVGSNLEQQLRQSASQQVSVTFEDFYSLLQRWIETRVFPSYEGLSIFFHDVTPRKKMEQALKIEQHKVENLLLNILPKPIAEQLKENPGIIAKAYKDVTILFADLVNFTQLASETSPKKLVLILNSIFSIFDQITHDKGLEKIKTIGDAYMVAGGLPIPRSDHAEAIADMALEMLNVIREFNGLQRVNLSLRIGINTGSVVAGVIGTKKLTYDLWGDAVNLASRMESHGAEGRIQVTESTYNRLQDSYKFEERGVVSIKGKGEMKTYWLIGKRTAKD